MLNDPRLPPRFWSKVSPEPTTGCWLWTAFRDHAGYGAYAVVRTAIRKPHRVAYEQLVGPVPSGLELDHLCRVRHCVNPAHLEPVSHLENVRRGRAGEVNSARIRARTHCPAGHPYAGSNLYVDPRGNRQCMECRRVARRRSYARRSTC